MQTLYVITTGGTIDKVYLERTGSVANLDTKIDAISPQAAAP